MACWFVHLYRIRDRLCRLDGGQGRTGRFPVLGFGDNQSDRTIVVVLYATQISNGGGRTYELVYNTCIKLHLLCVIPDLSSPLWPRVSSSDPTPRQDRTRPSSGASYAILLSQSLSTVWHIAAIRTSFSRETQLAFNL